MHQAFDAGFEFHKRAVVGNIGDLAKHARALRVAAVDAHPRVVAHLLEAQRHAIFLGVKLENLGGDFLAGSDDFAGVADPAPGHVGDVQQAVNPAEVDKGAVLSDVLDHTMHHRTFFEGLHQLGALFAHRGFDHGTA